MQFPQMQALRPQMNYQVTSSVQFGSTRPIAAKTIKEAFAKQKLQLDDANVATISDLVQQGVDIIKQGGPENSRVRLTAIKIAAALNLNANMDTSLQTKITAALQEIKTAAPVILPAWNEYFDKTVGLTHDAKFTKLVGDRGFSPVTTSWEDLSRFKNSAWGDRICDVCVWVRKDEAEPGTAKRTLTVRQSNNFRDNVLLVPSQNIKIHQKENGKVKEVSLPQRLRELGLASPNNDQEVLVSNQFTIVPVPGKDMEGSWKAGEAPRAAFNFSLQPYGSSSYVITDVGTESSEAVVGGRQHQLIFAKKDDGQRAPFTASRAEDRQDLLAMEAELKSQGMDVDIQRYYLIQVPLKHGTKATPANMGNPPNEYSGYGGYGGGFLGGADGLECLESCTTKSFSPALKSLSRREPAGLDRVAISSGEGEGPYNTGSGFAGERADEPIRVTVSYFVTPKGAVTEADMENFTAKFKEWDKQKIWGGSLVVDN